MLSTVKDLSVALFTTSWLPVTNFGADLSLVLFRSQISAKDTCTLQSHCNKGDLYFSQGIKGFSLQPGNMKEHHQSHTAGGWTIASSGAAYQTPVEFV